MTTESYQGRISEDGKAVVLCISEKGTRRPLPLRLALRRHSPTGFNWGYDGSGPAQLALAILADYYRGDKTGENPAADLRTERDYQDFKRKVVAALPQNQPWTLTREEVAAHVAAIHKEGRVSAAGATA